MPAGRPTKLNDQVRQTICDAIERGHYHDTAVLLAGVSEATFYNWRERGELDPDSIYGKFLEAVKAAEARSEDMLLTRVMQGLPGWQAHMTIMERRWPTKWGRSEKRYHEHSGRLEVVQVSTPTSDERREEVARILGEAS